MLVTTGFKTRRANQDTANNVRHNHRVSHLLRRSCFGIVATYTQWGKRIGSYSTWNSELLSGRRKFYMNTPDCLKYESLKQKLISCHVHSSKIIPSMQSYIWPHLSNTTARWSSCSKHPAAQVFEPTRP